MVVTMRKDYGGDYEGGGDYGGDYEGGGDYCGDYEGGGSADPEWPTNSECKVYRLRQVCALKLF